MRQWVGTAPACVAVKEQGSMSSTGDWHRSKPRNKKRELMRRAKTNVNERYGINGRLKERYKPRPITLPKMPWDDEKDSRS